MVATIEAAADAENARVIITARNGVPGDSLIVIRRDQQGTNLVRQTSGDALPFLPDPAGEKINLFKDPRSSNTLPTPKEVWRNQILNPATVTALTATERRRNLCPNPSFEANFDNWAPTDPSCGCNITRDDTTGRTSGVWSARLEVKTGVSNDNYLTSNSSGLYPGLVAGKTYTISADMTQTSIQAGALHARARSIQVFAFVGAALSTFSGTSLPNTVGTGRASVTFTVPAGVTQIFFRLYNGGVPGTVVWWDSVLVEETSLALPYFDGSFARIAGQGPSSGHMDATWLGLEDSSLSVLLAAAVPQYVATSSDSVVYAASYGGKNGVFISPMTASNATSAEVDGGAGALRSGLSASKTFTISALLHVPEVQTGSLHADARKIIVRYRIGAGAEVQLKSAAGANVQGTSLIKYTFTLPAGVTDASVRLMNGAAMKGGIVGWSELTLTAGSVVADFFTGDTPASSGLISSWTGTANASASVQTATGLANWQPGDATSSTLYQRVVNGKKHLAVRSLGLNNSASAVIEGDYTAFRSGLQAGNSYVVGVDLTILDPLEETGISSKARTVEVLANVSGAQTTLAVSSAAPSTPGTTRIVVAFTIPAGATGATVKLWNGSVKKNDEVLFSGFSLVQETWDGSYFDGETFNGAWTGAIDDSTSTLQTSSLPITIYDYEARQSTETTYILADDKGVPAGFAVVATPIWGTWVKDPFRPNLNAKVYWNADSDYVRKARRVLLQASGAELPVAHYDRRTAPQGRVRLMTETNAQSAKLVALIKSANVVMLDVDPAFGVPVRYVSLGDFTGSRVGDSDRDLKWEARIWTADIDEVAMPIGTPIGQTLTYDQLAASFGSYVAIPSTTDTYDDLAVGNWS